MRDITENTEDCSRRQKTVENTLKPRQLFSNNGNTPVLPPVLPMNLPASVSGTDSDSDDKSTEFDERLSEAGTSAILMGGGGGVEQCDVRPLPSTSKWLLVIANKN